MRGDGLRSAVGPEPVSPSPHDFDVTPKGDLYRTFGDSYTRAFELAFTPAIFGALGYAVDRWLGIVPVLTIVFALVALLTLMARTWYGYVKRMEVLEQGGPWADKRHPGMPA
ncbi:MAG: AtpZ/AtpI family protein [Actinobacteria bacterium]|nr:AtpZ/AtpI family protein [Actinomycetota bacterium]